MLLSFCLITRNAEQQLERALRSVSGLGAEVIVADTGSTDRTVARAQALGARTSIVAWHDDFAAAQNEALAEASFQLARSWAWSEVENAWERCRCSPRAHTRRPPRP